MTRDEANKVFDDTTFELVEIQRALNQTYSAWQVEVARYNDMARRRKEAWAVMIDSINFPNRESGETK